MGRREYTVSTGGRKQGYQAAYSQKFVRKQVQHEKKSFLKIKTDDKFVI